MRKVILNIDNTKNFINIKDIESGEDLINIVRIEITPIRGNDLHPLLNLEFFIPNVTLGNTIIETVDPVEIHIINEEVKNVDDNKNP